MSFKAIILAIVLFSFFPSRAGFTSEKASEKASNKAELTVTRISDGKNGWQVEAVVTRTTVSGVGFSAKDTGRNRSLGVSSSLRPINLWLLVDASASCQLQRIDGLLASLVAQIKKQLPEESLVSVVSYTGGRIEVHENHKPVRELEASSITCSGQTVSSTYEKPLNFLLEARKDKNLPVAAWVLTSGNVQLSESLAKTLKEADINVHLLLYNAIIANDLRPAIDQMNLKLGKPRIRMSVFSSEAQRLPERWYHLEVDAPDVETGKVVAVDLEAAIGGGQTAKTSLTAKVPSGFVPTFFQKYGSIILILGLVLAAGYLVYRIVRYYTPKHCGSCGKTLRYEDQQCFFCRKKEDGFLVGRFNQFSRRKLDKRDVVFLNGPVVEIGTHRRSRVKLARVKGERRGMQFKILKESGPQGNVSYRVEPASEQALVTLNGNPLRQPRYLAHGDTLGIKDLKFTFLVGT